jgi:hypothetical protein
MVSSGVNSFEMRTPLSARDMNLTSAYNGLDDRYHALIVTFLHYLQKTDLLDEGFLTIWVMIPGFCVIHSRAGIKNRRGFTV